MRRIGRSLLIIGFVFLLLDAGAGQTEEGIEKTPETGDEPVLSEEKPPEEKKVVKEEKRETPPTAPVKKPPVKPERESEKEKSEETVQDDAGDGLLEIVDGNFLYRRIPEIELPEREPVYAEKSTERVQEKRIQIEEKSEKEKGLFGMSRGTTDLVAKVVLILIIVIIFLLYRSRSRDRRSKVLRRFPRV